MRRISYRFSIHISYILMVGVEAMKSVMLAEMQQLVKVGGNYEEFLRRMLKYERHLWL